MHSNSDVTSRLTRTPSVAYYHYPFIPFPLIKHARTVCHSPVLVLVFRASITVLPRVTPCSGCFARPSSVTAETQCTKDACRLPINAIQETTRIAIKAKAHLLGASKLSNNTALDPSSIQSRQSLPLAHLDAALCIQLLSGQSNNQSRRYFTYPCISHGALCLSVVPPSRISKPGSSRRPTPRPETPSTPAIGDWVILPQQASRQARHLRRRLLSRPPLLRSRRTAPVPSRVSLLAGRLGSLFSESTRYDRWGSALWQGQ